VDHLGTIPETDRLGSRPDAHLDYEIMPDERPSAPGFDDDVSEDWGIESGVDIDDLSRSELVEHVAAGDLVGEEALYGARTLLARGDDAETLVAELEAVARDGDRECQIVVSHVLAHIAGTHPDAARGAAPFLVEMAASDSVPLRNFAIAGLAELAEEQPAAVRGVMPALADHLDSPYSNERRGAVGIAAAVSREHPEELTAAVPDLVDALAPRTDRENPAETIAEQFASDVADPADSRHGAETERVGERVLPAAVAEPYKQEREAEYGETVRHGFQQEQAAVAIANVASHDPESVLSHRSTLQDVLEADTTAETRRTTLDALYALAEHDPEAILPGSEAVADQLAVESDATRATAARVLALLGEVDIGRVAEVVTDVVPSVVELLGADEPWIRGAAATLLAYVAEVDPGCLCPGVEEVIELLDDDAMFVRGSAVACLRYLESEAARAALRETATSDPDEQIRRLASRALSAPR
jgi:hypothetical protein